MLQISQNRDYRFTTRRRAFSLVEIMVVLVIIGLLAGVVAVNVRGYLIRGQQETARVELAKVADALETYYSVYTRYPSNEQGLQALTQASQRLPEPLLKSVPVDPWERVYQYNRPGREGQPYEVFTLGADGREGGEGADADLGTWSLEQSVGGGDESEGGG